MSWQTVVTHGGTLLVGIFIGAAGAYYAELFTDRRRQKEAGTSEEERFRGIAAKMPDLLGEMKEDLSKPGLELARKFYFLPNPVAIWPAEDVRLHYTGTKENDYSHKIAILESEGYIIDVSDSNLDKYQMTEGFVELLMN
ncbi:hypothetical protein DDZ13_07400 [Coraliomargarita sinensis]|uniref:Uncharacterized protein n=1 Tax=Coraliomargarita sinensis TaxID=2174842 RepID=A0A317ZG09_9BACT|nr:hypothetical protein [Coraliomargarita sinensis]PXA04350.1 hypothetical protein DDZ13_07400 [Coraliomargarita sinensis]